LVDAAKPATRFSTHSVVFQDCGLLPFDMPKTFEKRCTRHVEEDPEIDEIRVDMQAWHPRSTVLASPELPADAAERSARSRRGTTQGPGVFSSGSNSADGTRRRWWKRRWMTTKHSRSAAERNAGDEWPHVDVLRGVEFDRRARPCDDSSSRVQ
jgi:hypothetical protein